MSRYLLDKFLYQVDRSPGELDAYARDPAGYVERWEKEVAHVIGGGERTSGHALSDAERKAIVGIDIREMYRLGAHPFILWTAMLPLIEQRHSSFPEALRAYQDAIAGLGTPDWST